MMLDRFDGTMETKLPRSSLLPLSQGSHDILLPTSQDHASRNPPPREGARSGALALFVV